MNVAPSDAKPCVVAGEFDVKIGAPEMIAVPLDASPIGRHVIEKTYQGALSGRSGGEMLTAGQLQKAEATYVALESFEGSLDGKFGGFALAHFGEMDAGHEELRIGVVPGSGTGELAGIRGHLSIRRESGKHYYTLTYWTR